MSYLDELRDQAFAIRRRSVPCSDLKAIGIAQRDMIEEIRKASRTYQDALGYRFTGEIDVELTEKGDECEIVCRLTQPLGPRRVDESL